MDCVEIYPRGLLYDIAGSEDLEDFLALISPFSHI